MGGWVCPTEPYEALYDLPYTSTTGINDPLTLALLHDGSLI